MTSPSVPPIGGRLRRERLRRGVSVRGLARDIGVSASLISQIETDRKGPSVSTLYAITTALGISVEDLFASATAAPAPGHERAQPGDVPVIRPEGRKVLRLDSGVTWELLGQVGDPHVDFLLITYQPGGTSSSSGSLMRRTGAEHGYLISGELILTLGADEHRLTAGDAVSFDAATPHSYRNDGAAAAVGLWLLTGTAFSNG